MKNNTGIPIRKSSLCGFRKIFFLTAVCMAVISVLAVLVIPGLTGRSTRYLNSENSGNSGKESSFVRRAAASKKTFTVGFDANFPPYGYQNDDGEFVGFDLDLAQEVCRRNGWKYVPKPIEWDSKDMALKSGSIDCIWNGFTMNGLEDEYTWSAPYVDNSQVVVVKKSSGIKKLSDLKGKVVAVQAASSALAALTGKDADPANKKLAKSFKTLKQVAEYNSAFLDMDSGLTDAVCLDSGVARFQLEKRGDAYVQLDEVLSTEQYAVGFKKGNFTLRDQVQKTLNSMCDDGTFNKIAKKWGLEKSVCLEETKTMEFKDEKKVSGGQKSGSKSLSSGTSSENASEGNSSSSFGKRLGNICGQLGKGFLSTFAIFILTIIFSLPLGLLVTFVRRSRIKVLQWLARIYISIMRGTPLMLQLLVVCYGPAILFKVKSPYSWPFIAAIIGFSVNYAAYFAEIFRSGIEGVPKGQSEAAEVLGFSKVQTFWHIVFPQMVKRVMPPVTNEIITLVKDTSLAFAIGYAEMFTMAKRIESATASLLPLFVAGVFYYIFNFVVAFVMSKIEKKLSYFE